MPHDTFNTRSGQIGFIATADDGAVYREDLVTWDEIPPGARIAGLQLVHFPSGHVYLTARPGPDDRVLFSNRATSTRDAQSPVHLGKLVGVGRGGVLRTVYLEFEGAIPTKQVAEVPLEEAGFAPHAFRPAR